MPHPGFVWLRAGSVLVDPRATLDNAHTHPRVVATAVSLCVSTAALGLAALPRQLSVLRRALGPTGNVALDSHYEAMTAGLTRFMVVDRLVPSATLVIAAVLVVLLGGPVLSLAHDRRRALWSLALLGLAPLLVQQLGSLLLTCLASVPADPGPGDAISLPHRFHTGPLLAWTGDGAAPHWLELLEARLNLVSLWCVALWAAGLRMLDGGCLKAWHVAVPVASVAAAGVLTWMGGPMGYSLLLGSP